MAGLRSRSISSKTLLLGVVPSLLMFLSLVFFFTSARLADARIEMLKRGQLIADQLAPACEYGVISGNTPVIRKLIDETLRTGLVYSVRVRDSMGETVAVTKSHADHFYPEESLIRFNSDIIQQPVSLQLDDIESFGSLYGFERGPLKVGSVEVTLDTDTLTQQQNEILLNSLLVGVLLLLFTLLVVRVMARSLAQPILNLADLVARIRQGDYQARSSDEGGAEIGHLAQNVNEMAATLERNAAEQAQNLQRLTQAHAEAEYASRVKSDFLALVSHELRTPLNGILGMLQLLEDSHPTSDQRDCLQVATRSTDHLLNLINDILDFSRLECGELQVELQDFPLRRVLNEVLSNTQCLAEEKGLRFSAKYQGELQDAWIHSDPNRLRQVLQKLLGNAVKFTDAGQIQVNACWQPNAQSEQLLDFSFEVQDSGVGLSKLQRKHLYESFVPGDLSLSRRHGGTGLGLTIAKRLLDLLGGVLEVESEEGQGSLFRIRLQVPFQLKALQGQSPSPRFAEIAGRTALVVEDNEVNQRVTRGILENMGVQVQQAYDGQEAVEKFRSGRFDIVFMDCQMPVKDGFESAREIRYIENEKGDFRTPIIALTANAMDGARERCITAGMDDYLAKPVRKQELLAILSRWIGIASVTTESSS